MDADSYRPSAMTPAEAAEHDALPLYSRVMLWFVIPITVAVA